ncbi:MAG: DNA topoisomerase [Candidatus Nezhaarchaeales archaeon]
MALGRPRGRYSSWSVKVDALIVAEKDSVARAFADALAEGGYRVMSRGPVKAYLFTRGGERWASLGLKGHLFDLDFREGLNRSWRSVDPRQLFFERPVRVVEEGSEPYLEALRELGREAEVVYLALDGDPEGESIAFEAKSVVEQVNPYAEFKRPWFSTLSPEELRRAIESPGELNPRLADKCFARMEMDLVIGASFTRLLTLSVERAAPRSLPLGRFLSYGPCQTPVLYLVVQRALEREAFKPEAFWRVVARVRVEGALLVLEHAAGRFKEREGAEGARERASAAKVGVVREFTEEESRKRPPAPLNTVELEGRASRFLNIRPRAALELAEELYRRGLISYPRTETEVYGPGLDLRRILAQFAEHPGYGPYASRLLERPLRPTKGSKDDRAHPPIHPVRPAEEGEVVAQLGRAAWRLYDLVVRHFLATLSPPARVARQSVVVDVGGELFEARGLRVVEPGYLEAYPFEVPDERPLPRLAPGLLVEVEEVRVEEGSTEPPPYISESELLKLMERLRIGTDATASQHIQTNIERGYFYVDKRRCVPTPMGVALIKSMLRIKPELVKPEVRGFMEGLLEDVAAGRRGREEVVEYAKKVFAEYYDEVERRVSEVVDSLLPTLASSLKLAEEGARRRATAFRRRR